METIRILKTEQTADNGGCLPVSVWDKAHWHSGFRVKGAPDSGAEPDTSFAMIHDNLSLYIAVRAAEPQTASVPAHDRETIERRDTGSRKMFDWVTSLDHIELLINTDLQDEWTSCLAFNRNGALAGLLGSAEHHVFDYDFGARVVAAADDRGWSAQLVVPLASLRLSPRSGTWQLNVVRIRVVRDETGNVARTISSFAPLPETAYYSLQPWSSRCLGVAEAENLDLDKFLWDVRTLGSAVVSGKDGDWTLRQKVRIGNLSGRNRRVEALCSVESECGSRTWQAARDVEPGEELEETVEIPLPSRDFGRLTIALTDTDPSELVFSRMCLPEREELSWKEHWLKQGDGSGGWTCREAKFQLMPRFRGAVVGAYGLAELDNGEIIFMGSSSMKDEHFVSVTAFSKDHGATWSDYEPVEGCRARPMMLTYLGGGELTFTSEAVNPDDPDISALRFFSHDYGRTWPEIIPVQPATAGKYFYDEGNMLVDRDGSGTATGIAGVGYTGFEDDIYMFGASIPAFRWSRDGGRTWDEAVFPPAWNWEDSFLGRTYKRGVSEGSVVRAANGWIVAALRTDCPGRYLDVTGGDNLEGTAISISRDEGKTWSPLHALFDGGRMHGNLLRLANDDLLLTVIRRIDVRGGQFASYRRGCDACISRDNGLTWDLDRMYILDDFPFMGTTWATPVSCGHLYSIQLSDGSLLTTYSHYHSGRPALIHWQP